MSDEPDTFLELAAILSLVREPDESSASGKRWLGPGIVGLGHVGHSYVWAGGRVGGTSARGFQEIFDLFSDPDFRRANGLNRE